MTDDKLREREARRICREMDMPEEAWPDMAKTISCASRVLAVRLRTFTRLIERQARRTISAAGFQ